ncbi:Uncharacterised protein [Mycobacteroides abscessus subsp. abscessus]|nr:Uncharacterised protein [Mycobacteroides abscessus subsp. abscessus]SKS33755.1 Uncharacterised protein [Mycobacteroides abscessus subsp. abscessus]
MRPAWLSTLVFGPMTPMPAFALIAAGRVSPNALLTDGVRTQRLRYHCALPSRSDNPCTMASPLKR